MKISFRKKGRSEEERFYDFVSPEPNSGCWLWVGHCYGSGYGGFREANGFHGHAHRYSWRLHNGAIPNEQLVLHKCDVRCCVNPEHLFIGDYSDNLNDMHAKGRGNNPRGEKHSRARLTENDIRKIRSDTRELHLIGADYNVDKQYVWKIKRGWHWKHVR